MSRFRMRHDVILDLCDALGPGPQRSTHRNHAVPVSLQVVTTLGFLATGILQRELADRSWISQPAFSCIMPDVLECIIGLSQWYINFPYTMGKQVNKKMQFAAMSGFSNVISPIDCTRVAIRAPSENKPAFFNRKHVHSIKSFLMQTWC